MLTETEHAQAVQLMTAAFILTGMRIPQSHLSAIYDGVTLMHETTAWDEVFEKGLAVGVPRGELRMLIRQGTRKFGAPDAATRETLNAITDSDRLERIGEAMLTADTWQELLDTP